MSDPAAAPAAVASPSGSEVDDSALPFLLHKASAQLKTAFQAESDEKAPAGSETADNKLKLNVHQFKGFVKGLSPSESYQDEWAMDIFELANRDNANYISFREFWQVIPKSKAMANAVAQGSPAMQKYFEPFFIGAKRRLARKRQRLDMMPQLKVIFNRYAFGEAYGNSHSTDGSINIHDFKTFIATECPAITFPDTRDVTAEELELYAVKEWKEAKQLWIDAGNTTTTPTQGAEDRPLRNEVPNTATPADDRLITTEAKAIAEERLSFQEFRHFVLFSDTFFADPQSSLALKKKVDQVVPPGSVPRNRCCGVDDGAPAKSTSCVIA